MVHTPHVAPFLIDDVNKYLDHQEDLDAEEIAKFEEKLTEERQEPTEERQAPKVERQEPTEEPTVHKPPGEDTFWYIPDSEEEEEEDGVGEPAPQSDAPTDPAPEARKHRIIHIL